MVVETITVGISTSLFKLVEQIADYTGISMGILIPLAGSQEHDIKELSGNDIMNYLARHSLPNSVFAESDMYIRVIEEMDPDQPPLSTKIMNAKLLWALIDFEADPRNAKHVKNLGWG